MLRSMYSGISGMKANQTKLDVIGNNIANVGTTAFKASTTKFKDMLSQNINNATAPTATQGGLNASQVGLGVKLSSIDTIMTQGNLQSTGRSLDVAIDGESQFFMVSKGPAVYGDSTLQVSHKGDSHGISSQSLSGSGSELFYTRDGGFVLDEQGNLLTSDGYRVLGYSLTNDDNGQAPTGVKPLPIDTAGLSFRLGPGSQLNDYKIVLGNVGVGTATSADVDKSEKRIILNGDFSENSTLTSKQVTDAINKSLSAAGISQRVDATGTPVRFSEINTDRISGGSSATSPNSVSVMGVTFRFGEGEQLNDYTIQIDKINATSTQATVDTDQKVIKLSANFIEKGAVTAEDLADAINKSLKDSAVGITQEVKATGLVAQVAGLNGITDDSGKDYAIPASDNAGKIDGKNGFSITFEEGVSPEKGAVLNGYSFVAIQDSSITDAATADAVKVSVNKDTKNVQIKFKGSPAEADVISAIKTALGTDITDNVSIKNITLPTTTSETIKVDGSNNGVTKTSTKPVTVGGFTLKFPQGTDFNGLKIQIEDISSLSPGARYDDTSKTLYLSGDFKDSNVEAAQLQTAINAIAGPPSFADVTVSGSAKSISGLTSNVIMGGIEDAAPTSQEAFGLSFDFASGSDLNGYRIQMGKITSGTQPSASIDTTDKVITVNGDFVNGKMSTSLIQNVINVALLDKGIEQNVRVTGNPIVMTGTESEVASGGTPVQSIEENGMITFVDGTKSVKSYDESLKTLRIPDSVVKAGTDEVLKVKSFTIDQSGVINCTLEDGSVAAVGQIALSSFKNPEGLTKMGGNLYTKSANSGDAIVRSGLGTINDDNSSGFGKINQGMIEMSNVDLAEQFTEMITTTRSFQASSKMISTGDEILQDIINLKR